MKEELGQRVGSWHWIDCLYLKLVSIWVFASLLKDLQNKLQENAYVDTGMIGSNRVGKEQNFKGQYERGNYAKKLKENFFFFFNFFIVNYHSL